MLIKEGLARNDDIDRRLASVLAAVAGALNAAAFYSVGFFSANMTGNVSTVSIRLALGQWVTGLFYLTILLAFVFGAAASTTLINAGRRRRIHRIYAYCLLIEAILLACLGCADLWFLGIWRVPTMVLGLAFLMGLQNATATRISGGRVRTTHISGLATDLGIELGTAFDILRGCEPAQDALPNRNKLRLHLYTIISFLLGGVVGVLLYRAVGGYLLVLSALLLGLTALTGIARAKAPGLPSPVAVRH